MTSPLTNSPLTNFSISHYKNNASHLQLGDKLKIVRKTLNISQEELGQKVGYTHSTLSTIESNLHVPAPDKLGLIRRALSIETVPLLDTEIKIFKDRLYLWLELIESQQLHQAQRMQPALSNILLMPFHINLCTIYNLFSVRLLMLEGQIPPALALMEETEKALEEVAQNSPQSLSEEALYHYHYTKGDLHFFQDQIGPALQSLLKAKDLKRSGYGGCNYLNFAIGRASTAAGHAIFAICHLDIIKNSMTSAEEKTMGWHTDLMIGVNYTYLGYYKKARTLLTNCLESALANKQNERIGAACTNLGYLFKLLKDYGTALYFLEEAITHFSSTDKYYLEALYLKGCCLAHINDTNNFWDLLNHAKNLIKKDPFYTILFTSLAHLRSPEDDDSIAYLEEVLLPTLLDGEKNMLAMDYCKLLLTHHEKSRNSTQRKRLNIQGVLLGLYSKMHEPARKGDFCAR